MSQARAKNQPGLGLFEKVERIRSGYSLKDLEQAARRTQIPVSIVRNTIGIHPRTFSRRIQSGASLSKPESDSLHRFLRIHQIAIEALGDAHKANCWLQQPSIALEDRIPLSLLDTDPGSCAVEEALRKVQYGIIALVKLQLQQDRLKGGRNIPVVAD